VKRELKAAKKQVKQLLKQVEQKDEKLKEQQARIEQLIDENEELRKIVPTEEEAEALEYLYEGNFEAAIEMFKEASAGLEKALNEREMSGKKSQMSAFQEHLELVAPEICYGIDGLSQNQFQRIVAMIGRHTVPESQAKAEHERTRKKRSGGYKPRILSPQKEGRRRANADAVYRWLEGKLGDDCVDKQQDGRSQLQAAEGTEKKPRLGVVGLTCSIADLPMSAWFAKERGVEGHKHLESLRCELQSKADPKLVGEDGNLTDSTLNRRSDSIKIILRQDPERRPLCDQAHSFWPKIEKGEEDKGVQGVGKVILP
jgi:hypothetical protein